MADRRKPANTNRNRRRGSTTAAASRNSSRQAGSTQSRRAGRAPQSHRAGRTQQSRRASQAPQGRRAGRAQQSRQAGRKSSQQGMEYTYRKGRKAKKKKPAQKWIRLSRRNHVKMMGVFFFIVAALAGMVARIMYIQNKDGDQYQKIVLANANYDSVILPFRRGDILDRNGVVLATSLDVYNIILDCSVLLSDKKYLEPTIQALMESFPDELSEADIRTYIRENPESKYAILAKHIPYEEVQAFQEKQKSKDAKEGQKGQEGEGAKEGQKGQEGKDTGTTQAKAAGASESSGGDAGNGKIEDTSKYIRGVWFEKEYQRSYPYKTLASTVIGFTTAGNLGMAGLENYYDSTLNGTNGRQYGYLNSDNSVEKTIKPAVDGNNIVTTIDMNIQSVVEAKIAEFDKAYRNHAREGAGAENIGVIVQNPNTGAILAMADSYGYDLSDPRSLKKYFTKEELAAMTEEEELNALNRRWNNYCITETYEPGSTQKPLTVAAGLDSGKLTGNEVFDCDGFEKVADRTIRCVAKYGHGPETVEGALMDSCNDSLMQMVRRIGKDIFYDYQSIFGMGAKTNIDLPGEAVTEGLVRSAQTSSSVDLATASFGQSFNCTMIQLVSAFSSIINGGSYYQPHVVEKVTDENGNTIEEVSPKLLKQTVSRETSDKLRQYLYATVNKGSAAVAKVPGYSMGGKTGTAEKMDREKKEYLVSFIGYLPQENPQLVIYAVIDTPNRPRGEDQAHSVFAQNLAREILEEILPYMNIYKDEKVKKGALTKKRTNMYTGVTGYEAAAALGEAVTYD